MEKNAAIKNTIITRSRSALCKESKTTNNIKEKKPNVKTMPVKKVKRIKQITEIDHFIYIDENNLSVEFCNKIIEKFNADERKIKGRVGSNFMENVSSSLAEKKKTMDLFITGKPEWKEIDEQLTKRLHISIDQYLKEHVYKMKKFYDMDEPIINSFMAGDIVDFGYQIQSYKKNEGFYHWHCDFVSNKLKTCQQVRLYTFIWYLNDVNDGGETEFLHGLIKPKAGKILIFPSTITYYHRGRMPISDDKYIITGWIGYKVSGYL